MPSSSRMCLSSGRRRCSPPLRRPMRSVPPEWVLDQLDETEPEKVVWEYYKSQLTQTYLEAVKQRVVLMAARPQPPQPEAGIPGLEGANQAAGTPPPNAMMPGATREMMTRQTRLGGPIAG